MGQRLVLVVAFAIAFLSAARALAAPDLPSEAKTDDIVALVYLDLRVVDPAELLGADWPEFTRWRRRFLDAGGQTLVAAVPGALTGGLASDRGSLFVGTRARANSTALQAVFTEAGHEVGDLVRVDDKWLRVALWDQAPLARPAARPLAPDEAARRRERVQAAWKQVGDSPIAVVLVPTADMRGQGFYARGQVPARGLFGHLNEAVVKGAAAEWLVAYRPDDGRAIRLAVTGQFENESDAAALRTEVGKVAVAAVAYLKDMDQRPTTAESEANVNLLLVLQSLRAEGAGSRVTLGLNEDQMRAAMGQFTGLQQRGQAADMAAAATSMRRLLVGVQSYTKDHQGAMPDDLPQLARYYASPKVFAGILKNPRVTGEVGFVYVKPAATLGEIKDPATTPILYEGEDGKRDLDGCIGYADGHVAMPAQKPTTAPAPAR